MQEEKNNMASAPATAASTNSNHAAPNTAASAVLKPSVPIPHDATEIRGLDFNTFTPDQATLSGILDSMATTGFQASAISEAVRIINRMISWRDPANPASRTTIFLGYTSNLVSSGLREILRYLVEHRHVSAIVTTAGGVEEDLIKCLGPTYLGDFAAAGATLRDQGINRIGNLFVPNDNYCKFEDWVVPIFDRMLDEQDASRAKSRAANAALPNGGVGDANYTEDFHWTPSKMIARLGRELNNDASIYTWAARNDIPVFCPALTDGSLGDMLYFHSYRASPRRLHVDINEDIRAVNDMAMKAANSGIVILGGGIVKHHIANANLMRNGAEHAVFINTANEFDGSDAGARPDEAVSWGKVKGAADGGENVKVYAEATVVWPMIVASTFKKADMERNGQCWRDELSEETVAEGRPEHGEGRRRPGPVKC